MALDLRLGGKFAGMGESEWTDISTEETRTYNFPTGSTTISKPMWLHVSESGGHRILDADGISHYIPSGWIHLKWIAKSGKPHFVK